MRQIVYFHCSAIVHTTTIPTVTYPLFPNSMWAVMDPWNLPVWCDCPYVYPRIHMCAFPLVSLGVVLGHRSAQSSDEQVLLACLLLCLFVPKTHMHREVEPLSSSAGQHPASWQPLLSTLLTDAVRILRKP